MTKGKFFIKMLLLVLLLTSCTITNKYGEYKGKVIDAETKQPIEGAAVLAVYYVEQASLAGSVTHYADAQETVTDKNGEFKIPAMRVNKFKILSGWDQNPSFTIFKPGYGCFPNHKGIKKFEPWWSLPANQYVTIELPRLKTKEERLKNQSCFPVGVPDAKMKKFIEINNIERINLELEPTHLEEKKK